MYNIMKNDKKIVVKDMYGDNCLKDNVHQSNNEKKRHPQGWVEIYEIDENNNKKLHAKSNLVVYLGRETIAQRMFGIDNLPSESTKDETITWLGVGSGGVNIGDPFNPSPPVATDTDLAISIGIVPDTDSSCADPRSGFFYKKPIENIEFEQDTYNNNSWLIVKTISRISLGDCKDEHISEAGLFTSEGGPIAGYTGDFHLFSRVTFPPVVKTDTRQLLFVWYIYF